VLTLLLFVCYVDLPTPSSVLNNIQNVEQYPGLGLGISVIAIDLRDTADSPLSLYMLSLACPFVEYIDLRGVKWLTSPSLLRFLRICNKIKEVRLKGTGIAVDDDGLSALCEVFFFLF
jgi:hypothetical protein